ncbi:onanonoxo-7-onima-8-eninoihtemlysoneda [Histoplasma capsulatum var. duboisii H88]|uniref:Bifunctional dethiobiotin synthetase/adenosylmethionine-8-amino-7-oxononanoate aminotransferase n=1 Tax=Ajellomyces capsulatus (strain H88) TaxID=544711 RepID=E6PBP8_AJEC8|nr:onanonoxo-7-onima-8-eninoihtemlysoneda [Histoplasma capsulatum var. duboisii H88]DAA33944.1 TPA_inf: bifunctional dethiobiotin synthetase/adenosylmethionine-8-amino-7-oxononanoate aminotransferase [Histoplasma capsulatum var. duboisii H88]
MACVGAFLSKHLLTYQVCGANTNVGKTVFSSLLYKAHALSKPKTNHWYLKPVSTGPECDRDDRHISRFAKHVSIKCLYIFDQPVSPHLAAAGKQCPGDGEIVEAVSQTLHGWAQYGRGLALVETAGGVLSPGPNGTLQSDLYRPLRLPVILVADSRLGGISSSIAAFESLSLRGYDVHAVAVLEDSFYQNHTYLEEFFLSKRNIPVLTVPQPPPKQLTGDDSVAADDEQKMSRYYEEQAIRLLTEVHGPRSSFLDRLSEKHHSRISELESMSARAHSSIWYPFTQHQSLAPKDIMVIDSAYGDCFQTSTVNSTESGSEPTAANTEPSQKNTSNLLRPTFDGSASWWTQCLGHGNPELSLEAAYAAGRYGHVILPGAIHEPALSLAESLIKMINNPRLKRAFYSDNGSTGMEVAVKMALRVACKRYNWGSSKEDIEILGLRGSYHGDTIGTMDLSEPSIYNKKVEWYRGRGHWFNFPTVKMLRGRWIIEIPQELKGSLGNNTEFPTRQSIFDLAQRKKSVARQRYYTYIKRSLEKLICQDGRKFGALIMEPVILGAGGMLFADPLFQQTMVEVVRENPALFGGGHAPPPSSSDRTWSGLPVVFDEVFTGLYRLGRASSASFLDTHADISVHAKLLTGGLVPLCITLASEDIFDAFCTPHKVDALLHGHSYTAHPVGCRVAEASLRMLTTKNAERCQQMQLRDQPHHQPHNQPPVETGVDLPEQLRHVWSSWSDQLVLDLSHSEQVEAVFALGTVLSISLRSQDGSGYGSNAAAGLQQRLGETNADGFNIHCRVLGNVLYLMCDLTSGVEQLARIEKAVCTALL